MLINKHNCIGPKCRNDSKVFIKYLNHLNDIYENIDECHSNKKRKILIVFDDDMIADMLSNE